MGYLGAPVAEEYGGRGLDYVTYGLIVEEVGRGDSLGAHGGLGPDLARLRLDRALGQRGAEAGAGCRGCARARRSAASRLTEPDTGSDAAVAPHARDEDRRRLEDLGPEDVDLAGQRRRGRADLRPDRPREGAPRARLLPRPDRRATATRRRRSTASSACAPPTPPRSRSTRSRSATTRCSARSATASRSR